jgi:hypothetical protein
MTPVGHANALNELGIQLTNRDLGRVAMRTRKLAAHGFEADGKPSTEKAANFDFGHYMSQFGDSFNQTVTQGFQRIAPRSVPGEEAKVIFDQRTALLEKLVQYKPGALHQLIEHLEQGLAVNADDRKRQADEVTDLTQDATDRRNKQFRTPQSVGGPRTPLSQRGSSSCSADRTKTCTSCETDIDSEQPAIVCITCNKYSHKACATEDSGTWECSACMLSSAWSSEEDGMGRL